MQLTIEQLEDGITRIGFDGRLDLQGAQAIDQKLALATSTRALRLALDLSRLTVLASIGIRSMIATAKAQASRGGRVVMFSPEPNVRRVLVTAGIDQLVPLCEDFEAARAALRD
jgi:anti-anti-sigma factor